MIGGWQWVILLVVVLLLFGSRIPGIARSLGSGITEFRRGLKDGSEKGDKGDKGDKGEREERAARLERTDTADRQLTDDRSGGERAGARTGKDSEVLP